MGELPLLIFVVGPTASGKSAFAVELAEALQKSSLSFLPEILNGDSIQFFQGVEIGAAKPEPDLLARVPHHLLSVIPLGESFTAGDFRRAALKVIENCTSRAVTTTICVGGSGFYLQALEKGMYPVPEVPSEVRSAVEAELDKNGSLVMYQELVTRDPETAKCIQPQDRYRISRCLEVLRSSVAGETISEMKRRFESERAPAQFHVVKIGLERTREELRRRIEVRTDMMLSAGLIAEVKALREQGYRDWPPLHSVGYHEVQDNLDGKLKDSELRDLIVTSTLQLAKRQMTWFRRDKATLWVNPEMEAAIESAVAQIQNAMSTLT